MSDILTPQQEPETKLDFSQSNPSSDNFRNLNFLSLKGFFGIENATQAQEDALNEIYDYFEKAGMNEMADILINIKSIERKIGATPIGMGRETMVKNYLKIQKQIDDLNKQKQAYER